MTPPPGEPTLKESEVGSLTAGAEHLDGSAIATSTPADVARSPTAAARATRGAVEARTGILALFDGFWHGSVPKPCPGHGSPHREITAISPLLSVLIYLKRKLAI